MRHVLEFARTDSHGSATLTMIPLKLAVNTLNSEQKE